MSPSSPQNTHVCITIGKLRSLRKRAVTVATNPYHFIAAVGMGRAYLEMGNPVSALESFRRALRLNPDLEGVRVQADRLAKLVEGT